MVGITRRVLVVEDDALLSALIANLLRDSGFEVETAADTATARKIISKFDPDLVLLDLSLGDGPSGTHLANALHKDRPDIAILVLTKYVDARSISSQAQDLPPSVGFLRKSLIAETGQLTEAIEEVLADRPKNVRHDLQASPPFANLPTKGQDVLRLLAAGYSNQEIAKQTELSIKSVERWIERIYQELKINSSGQTNPRVKAATLYLRQTGAADKE
jgi:DNA-binding NarL/FixJ family response regulator